VGDPSGRSSERRALDRKELESNVSSMTSQIHRFFRRAVPFAQARSGRRSSSSSSSSPSTTTIRERAEEEEQVTVLNNAEWLGQLSLLDFLSGPGKRARVSTMLARESVKGRLQSSSGISFTEFSYQLLQAYDFLELYRRRGCTVQLGGNDQVGNIMSGIEMIIRETRGDSSGMEDDASSSSSSDSVVDGGERPGAEGAYGVTLPLLTTSSGAKFGKSAGNAVWLDEDLTSPFELYQVRLYLLLLVIGR
jgi:tyrosyl-tRNA synthetase